MSEKICRWGILGAANIARKNWHSIAQSGNGRIMAVASRNQQKAQSFVDSCQQSVPVPHTVDAVEGYDALLNRSDIDAVYVPLPTALRTEWVIKAANAGKHVVVEKPCGVTAAEVQAMIDACTANNVQFMDGVMFMHSARLPAIRSVLADGNSIGDIRRITSHFTFAAGDSFVRTNIRGSGGLEPAGCLGDLGWYNIRFTLWTMQEQLPVEVRGRVLHSVTSAGGEEIPLEFSGEMHFENGVSATFYNSFRTNDSQWATISGSDGYLHVEDYVLPFYDRELHFETSSHGMEVDGCRFNMGRHTRRINVKEYSNNAPDAQETQLFRTFAGLVTSGQVDPYWPDIALRTQRVMDAALRSAHSGSEAMTP